jgi:tetratricopeptide (TPR) repeat protein
LAPENQVAAQELDTLAEHYAQRAASAADEGKVDDAINFLDRASAANAVLPELDFVRQKIQQATTTQAAIDDLLQQASAYRAAGALVNPAGENAAELYHRVLATDPGNVIAAHGLNEIVSQLRSTTNQLLIAGGLVEATALVDRAGAAGLDMLAVNDMKASVNQETVRRDSVVKHLAQAQKLLSQGFITQPQEANVVGLLREVERLDPGNESAKALLARSAQRLADAAQDAYTFGMADDAKYYLELALTVTPDVIAWRDLRSVWEQDAPTN